MGVFKWFKLQSGPRLPLETKKLLSVSTNFGAALEKVENEVNLGRVAGPFKQRPISNLRCSPIGVVPKKTGGWRLITHLSYPPNNSVNDYIDECFTIVHYSHFDNAVNMVEKLGKGALIGKKDIKSAFRLLPCYPGDFDLLGFKLEIFIILTSAYPWVAPFHARHLNNSQLSYIGT